MIRIERLRKSYGSTLAVADLDLEVECGQILGFIGPNGAGKSTTLKVLTGLIPADSGSASVCGFDVATHPLEAKRRLGYVPESPKLYETLTADAFLDVIGALHHLDDAVSRRRREELLDLFGLGDARHQFLRTFSKGMKQKVVIAAALMHRPDVLVLDEPLDGVDANTALVVRSLLRQLAADGRTVLFSSHVLELVERICTRICILDDGRKVAEGTIAEVLSGTRADSLAGAFGQLTGIREPSHVSADILAALNR
jgi:ABC-2 type transport system ATP-binding protein